MCMKVQDRSRPRLPIVLSLLGVQVGSLEVAYSDERRERHPLFIGGSLAAPLSAFLATSSALYDSPGSGGNRWLLIITACSVSDAGPSCDIRTLPSQNILSACHLIHRGIDRSLHHILPAS